MADENYDPWKLSSGLRDDMVLSIVASYFATDAEYQGGRQYLLHLIGYDELGEEATLKMSVGADWESSDGGNTITHPTKKQQNINGSTIYGHFLTHALEIPDLVTVLRGRGGPTNAKVWEGLILHLQEREIKFGKTIEPQQRLMPTEYFGLVADAPNPNNTQAPTPPATQGIPTVPQAPVITPAYDPPQGVQPAAMDPAAMLAAARAQASQAQAPVNPLYQKYFDLAKTTDWPAFLQAALADNAVLADEELAQQIINQGLLWTQARS